MKNELRRMAQRIPLNWSEYVGWAMLWWSVGYILGTFEGPRWFFCAA